jgi:DNA (cytosine-5)-methyltransferase 1
VLTFGSLFAGIGGFDLGFERAGMQCKWQVEIDPYCQRVLAKHWPDVRRHDDVRTFPPGDADDWRVDVICGGFPCQDISDAGKQAGIDGDRSGLWREYARIIRVLRPSYVVVENVSALLDRGLGRVLSDLAESGYDAEWDCLPAFAFGAPHLRDRVFVIAYPQCRRLEGGIFRRSQSPTIEPPENCGTSFGTYLGKTWGNEPQIPLLDDGLTGKLAEFSSRGTGNAVVPQVAQWIGERIVAASNHGTEQE